MTDYSDWKVKKSVINYSGDDETKQAAATAANEEMVTVVDWCNENGYTIGENDTYYFTEKLAEPTHDEIKQQRIEYRRNHIDDQTAERSRRQANNTWTEDDEAAYLALDAEVTAYIEEHYPYPDETNDDEVA